MWKSKKSGKRLTTAKIDTLIGPKVEVHGSLLFAGGLHVDGLVRGDVGVRDGEGKHAFLTVSETGVIEGDVRVPNVVLSGRVVGDVVADDHAELKASATVTGNVYYHLLEMSKGAEVNGELVHLDEEEQAAIVAELD